MYMLTANPVRRVKVKLCEDTTIYCVIPARDHTTVVPRDTSGIIIYQIATSAHRPSARI
ncbi:hypothetical protein F4677DRAFT_429218 [Hypoxylon crocopeplum]|nr:hypothetical protein F4677DRAFT_429218 [Hypoxylon crocopeplum]